MDLEIEQTVSLVASVQPNDELASETGSYPADVKGVVENICEAALNGDSESLTSDLKAVKEVEFTIPAVLDSPQSAFRNPSDSSLVMRKRGLKKWRRIRRDFIKDASPPNIDDFKILKRASSSMSNPTRPHLSAETTLMGESVGSVNNLVMNSVIAVSSPIATSNLDCQATTGIGFSLGMNSEENDDDGSSKSSTAASPPNLRNDLPMVSGYVREKNRKKKSGSKAVSSLMQQVQQGKGKIRTCKKPRGERVNVNKENSHSSMESDSRSSNFIFVQGTSSPEANINEKKSGRSIKPDGEDGQKRTKKQLNQENQTCSYDDNVEQFGDHLRDKGERSDNGGPFTDKDPLDESVTMLEYVQEALEKEVEQLGEIGRKCAFSFNASRYSSPDTSKEDGKDQNLELQVVTLKEKVKSLEARLKLRESSTTCPEHEEFLKEMEREADAVFGRKIEAEVEFMVITQKLGRFEERESADVGSVEGKRAIRRAACYLLLQLILTLAAFWVLISRLSRRSSFANIAAPT